MTTVVVLRNDVTRSRFGQVNLAGTITDGSSSGQRSLDDFVMFYLITGSARYIDRRHAGLKLRPGDGVLIPPRVVHEYGAEPGGGWEHLYLVFNGPLFGLLLGDDLAPGECGFPFTGSVEKTLPDLLEIATPGAAVTDAGRRRTAIELFDVLAGLVTGGPAGAGWVELATTMVLRDPRRSIPQVADDLGMGYEAFRKRFRQEIGVAPATYREHHRVSAASAMLRSTTLSLRAIAGELGYADEFHFSKRFRQATGVAPGTFRSAAQR